MNTFLLRLWDMLLEASPVAIISQDEMGVMLLGGRFWKVLRPGWYFKIPYICTVHKRKVCLTSLNASDQAVMDKAGRSWCLSVAILFSIVDIRKALLDTSDVEEVLLNETMSEAASVISRMPEVTYDTVCSGIRDGLEFMAYRIGVEIEDVRLTDFVRSKAIRLMGTGIGKA